MADISDGTYWSETDASNNGASPNGAAEGMAPSGVNDTIRADRGAIKRMWDRLNHTVTTAGTTTAYTATYAVAPASYAAGERFGLIVNATCGAAPTLNINGLGARTIRKFSGGAWGALAAGDIVANQRIEVSVNNTDTTLDITAGASVGQSSGALYDTFLSKSASYTVVAGDEGAMILVDASGGVVTISLPGIAGVGDFKIGVAKIDASANAVIVSRAGADTVNGGTSVSLLTQYETLALLAKSGTTAWYVVDYAGVGRLKVANAWAATQSMSGAAFNHAKGADIAGAASIDIGAATGNDVVITGSGATIAALGTVQAGTRRVMYFAGAHTLAHNATSLILPGGANIATTAGARCEMLSLGAGNWLCLWFTKADGTPVVAPATAGWTLVEDSGALSAVASWTSAAALAGYSFLRLEFDLVPATDSQQLRLTPIKAGPTSITAVRWGAVDVYEDGAGSMASTATAGGASIPTMSAAAVRSGATTGGISGVVHLFDINSTRYKKGRVVSALFDGTRMVNGSVAFMVEDAAALTALKFDFASGNIATGRVRLWGK